MNTTTEPEMINVNVLKKSYINVLSLFGKVREWVISSQAILKRVDGSETISSESTAKLPEAPTTLWGNEIVQSLVKAGAARNGGTGVATLCEYLMRRRHTLNRERRGSKIQVLLELKSS